MTSLAYPWQSNFKSLAKQTVCFVWQYNLAVYRIDIYNLKMDYNCELLFLSEKEAVS